jgi:catechol 2,3-dioxygenase-like lactoylglutathione lyase family enzyme
VRLGRPGPGPDVTGDRYGAGMFLGLRTAIYPVDDLQAAKAWFTEVLGFGPYFDEPFFVGFNVGGYELALLPHEGEGPAPAGPLTYWGVPDADAELARLLGLGATVSEPLTEVGEGIKIGSVVAPMGSVVGIIENPVFALPADTDRPANPGPGR